MNSGDLTLFVHFNLPLISVMSHQFLSGTDRNQHQRTVHHSFIGSDLLESILGVLFQLTEEGDFKLVSDKQQLGT